MDKKGNLLHKYRKIFYFTSLIIYIIFAKCINRRFYNCLEQNHKKRKDSLETRAERVVLRAYVKNHPLSRNKHARIKLCQKKCRNSSKKQISTISNTEWRAKLVDH